MRTTRPLPFFLICLLATTLLAGCRHINIYERTRFFPKQVWADTVKPQFTFQIVDTQFAYRIYAVIRNTQAYNYNNLWLNLHTLSPSGRRTTQRMELQLADNERWRGTAAMDVVDHRILITREPINLQRGYYTFTLEQIMRENPLQGIMNAGIRVEKLQY